MPGRLDGKIAIITGASSGIGAATGERFAVEGAKVGLFARRAAEGLAVSAAIRNQGGESMFIQCDVTNTGAVEAAVAEVVRTYGGLHIVFNNAGSGARVVFPDESDEMWQQVLDVNLNGTFRVCRAAWPHLIAGGGGAIINMSSLTAVAGVTEALRQKVGIPSASYGVAKAGIEAFTRYIAALGGPQNIRVNCVRPGQILTARLTTSAGDHYFAPLLNEVQLLKGAGYAEDVANAVLFLASEESRFITAEIMNIDGGAAAKV